MPKVLCKLLNASEYISGVKFVSHQDGMLSEEISDDVAAAFLEVPGYDLASPVKRKAVASADPVDDPVDAATDDAETADAALSETTSLDAAASNKAANKAAKQAAAAAARA